MNNGATEVHILLVEGNRGDVRPTLEALRGGRLSNQVSVARDGEEALDSLRRRGKHTGAEFMAAIRGLENFWTKIVWLPPE